MTKFRLNTTSALILTLCASTSSHAQRQPQAPLALPTVNVTSTPIIESNDVDSFSGTSTKVTAAQIKNLNALDLAAALRMAPGVQISRYNEVGSYSGDQGGNVYIRGLGVSRPGSEIKTYLDGIPVYMGVWNHPLMDLLPLQGIQAVEIHKGPQNQTNGNNFASINLQSKRATTDGVHGELHASLGTMATKVLQAHLLGRQGDVDYALTLGHVDSNGERANADGRLNNAMGRITTRLNAAWSVGASFLVVNNEVGDPGDDRFASSTSAIGPYSFANGVGRNDATTHLYTAFVSHQHGHWTGEFKAYINQGHNNLAQDANWGTFDSQFKMSGFRWRESFSPWANGQVVASIDQETVSGSVSGPHVGSAVGTPFGFGTAGTADVPRFRVSSAHVGLTQDVSLSEGWVLRPSVGLRAYDSNRHGAKTAPHAGVSLIGERTTFYAQYAEGVLYPGAETYTLTRAIPMAFAADNGWDRLAPSVDKHTEVGVQWDITPRVHLDVSVFQDDISDRYVWSGFYAGAIANPASGTWSNSFPAYQTRGAEASLRAEITPQWAVFGSITTLDPSLSKLPYAPETAVSLGVTGSVMGYRLALDGQYQSKMYSLTQDRGSFSPNEVDSLAVANARVSYPLPTLGKKGEVYLALNNLFDARYAYNAGYPMPGRQLRIGLIASF
jgi:outer membrane cobalamin receptor